MKVINKILKVPSRDSKEFKALEEYYKDKGFKNSTAYWEYIIKKDTEAIFKGIKI